MAGILGTFIDSDEQDWSVSENQTLSYNLDDLEYETSQLTSAGEHADTIIRSVSFKSRGEKISGMMRIPRSENEVPGVLVLPGAGVTKEQQTAIPTLLADMGYASITIDQRNLGAVDPEQDLELFSNGNEPVEYMMVHDALMAADVLKAQSEVSDDIAMLGLSNGGRFAIIATAIDPEIKGVVTISTAGYNIDTIGKSEFVDEEDYIFYSSIDPDNYLDMITPRRFVMFHSFNDSIIPYELAQRSFDKAQEPKVFYGVEGSTHGYNPLVDMGLEEELELMFH
ncbi:dienelactone hydrolase family protein [Methanolobus sp. ZRKC3]|uniref:alpha/beta hydrolase n=1 Tax=Methanolobus sp. ZRKC3 TaxID=3125786 RepID=UPI00325470F3